MNGLVKRLGSAFRCLCLGFGLRVLPGSAGEAQDGQRPVSLLVCDEQDGRYRLEALLRACGLPVVSVNRAESVSYTHLDVYKSQPKRFPARSSAS